MIGGYMHCGSDDIMILVCHVILQNHVIEGSWDFMDQIPAEPITSFLSLVAICTVVINIYIFFVTWSYKTTRSKSHVT